jgi:predicted secreted protein
MNAMKTFSITAVAFVVCLMTGGHALADPSSGPFKELPGRWIGQGRLGLQGGKIESVKCRATYFTSDDGAKLKQNVRCASPSGKIEVKSVITHSEGELSGTWNELVYNLGGELSGSVTKRGFRISVRGSGLAANMEVAISQARQIIEIQFFDSTLIGLSLLLQKG